MAKIRLGIPKGSLQDATIALFAAIGHVLAVIGPGTHEQRLEAVGLGGLFAVDQRAALCGNLTLLVPGERVAGAAAAAGFTRIVTANDATDNAMLEAIIHTVQ